MVKQMEAKASVVDARAALEAMEQLFFSISPTGLLAYSDPLVGVFENQRWGLRIRVDPDRLRLTVEHHDVEVISFDLTLGVGHALKDATSYYWGVIQEAGRVTRSGKPGCLSRTQNGGLSKPCRGQQGPQPALALHVV